MRAGPRSSRARSCSPRVDSPSKIKQNAETGNRNQGLRALLTLPTISPPPFHSIKPAAIQRADAGKPAPQFPVSRRRVVRERQPLLLERPFCLAPSTWPRLPAAWLPAGSGFTPHSPSTPDQAIPPIPTRPARPVTRKSSSITVKRPWPTPAVRRLRG
jgi:hypothetical protein